MRIIIALIVVVALFGLCQASVDYRKQFESFKSSHGKVYADTVEETKRFNIFVQNMVVAAGQNALNPHASFGVNIFSDLSAEEFKAYHRADKYFAEAMTTMNRSASVRVSPVGVNQKIDWRTKGAVTAVKDQGQCGSCWAFSTTGNIEGQWKLAGHPLVAVSEQELVSCDTTDDGCNGGLMDNAFKWLIAKKGGWVVTEASYPYKSGGGTSPRCDMNGRTEGAKISSYKNIAHNEAEMATYLYSHGPLAIAVDATSWQTYNSGIMTNCISQQLDHGVLAVGFDQTHNPPYWIIKNSWSASWGEHGYIRVEMNRNECLINNYPCTAIV